MPEQEFELYLSALAKRLRLSPKQKTEIAAELRDQLESRFQSLLDAGLSREDAIRKALEDCGDGTVLARELAGVQRIVRRRRLLRIGLIGVGIAALLLLGVRLQLAYMEHADRQLALGAIRQDYIPQESSRDDGPSMMTVRGMGGLGSGPVVMVQNGGSGGIRLEGGLEGAGPVPVPRPAVEPTPAETLQRTLEERLDQIWDKDVDLVDVPCGEAFISIVRDEGKLPLIVRRTLVELMTTAVSVTLKVPKGSASLRTLLELLLEQAGIEGARLVVQDGLLVLTDVDSAARVEVYPIGHLLISGPTTAGMGAGDMAGGLAGGPGGGSGFMGPDGRVPNYLPPGMMPGLSGATMAGGDSGAGVALPAAEGTTRSRPIYAGPDAVGLVRAIVANIEGDWQVEGGRDSISEVNGLLVVRADTRTHRRLQELLRKLAAARQPALESAPTYP